MISNRMKYYECLVGIFTIIVIILTCFNYAEIIHWDIDTFYAINQISNPILNIFMTLITHTGSGLFVGTISLIVFLISKNLTVRRVAVLVILGLIVQLVLIGPIKFAFDRERPPQALSGHVTGVCNPCPTVKVLEHESGPSFPSGHAGRFFIIGVILWFVVEKARKFAYISFIMGVIVSISRVYVGMHFPLDVIVGALFGLLSGFIALRIEKQFKPRLEKIVGFRFRI
jgi:undecaprenyl-diphosphatase